MLNNTVRSVLGGSTLAIGLALAGNAGAALFTFSGEAAGGVGSATMDIVVDGNMLTATLDNTSPLTTTDGLQTNTPGITGFGFDLAEPIPTLIDWSLTAFTMAGVQTIIGGSAGTWIIDGTIGGLTLDVLACDSDPNCDAMAGALYNPAATEGFGALPNWFTTATLTMNFESPPELDAFLGDGNCNAPDPCSPFVRFQNVGSEGEGSLRLPGIPDDDNGGPIIEVPEPGSLALMGLGLLALFGFRRRNAV